MENLAIVGGVIIALLVLLLGCGVWVGITLGITGGIALLLFTTYNPIGLLGWISYNSTNSFVLSALPLFFIMGEVMLHSGISKRLFSGLSPWLYKIPGKLLHSNVMACTFFAAVSGSSAATAATIGTIALPELKSRGYSPVLIVGSLAGAGTLGLLIPPSGILIIYGWLTQQSVAQLFMAGILPGLIISSLFMLYIAIRAKLNPKLAPGELKYSWRERWVGLAQIAPTALLIFAVLGSIYLGWATPTESAAIGAAGAIVVGLAFRSLTWGTFKMAMLEAVRLTCMVLLIMVGASVLSSVVCYLRVPQIVAEAVAASGLPRYAVMTLICFVYLGLGCLFDGISMMVMTLPVIFPVVITQGFDPIWFGILLVVLIEVAQITPPVGFNLFVLQSISGYDIWRIARWALPFFFLLIVGILIIFVWPEMVLFLPRMMIGG